MKFVSSNATDNQRKNKVKWRGEVMLKWKIACLPLSFGRDTVLSAHIYQIQSNSFLNWSLITKGWKLTVVIDKSLHSHIGSSIMKLPPKLNICHCMQQAHGIL